MDLPIVGRILLLFVFVAATYLFFENFATNTIRAGKPREFETFQADSQRLVVGRLSRHRAEPETTGPFLVKPDGTPYTAQVGLQGWILSVFDNRSLTLDEYLRLTETIVAFLAALMFAGYTIAMGTRFGVFAMITTFAGIYSSEWIVLMAKNLYWVSFLFFLPVLWSWCAYERLSLAGMERFYYLGVSLLLFIKSLCGYEYITNIILGASIPVIYYEISYKTGFRSLQRVLIRTWAAGFFGVIAAMALHITIGVRSTGSLNEAFSMILDPARYRTIDYSSFAIYDQAASMGLIDSVQRYLSLIGVRLNVLHGEPWTLSMGTLILAAIVMSGIGYFVRSQPGSPNLSALSISVFFSLLASLSWAVLAKGHMFFHIHLNGVIFYYPLLLTFFPLAGVFISRLINRMRGSGFPV